MPLYEYECKQCKRHTENIQKFSDPEITECPYCAGLLERVISAPAIAFKGGGWFADGYGNAKPAASTNDSANQSKNDSGATSSSSEAAPSPAKDTTAAPASSGSNSPATSNAGGSSASTSENK